MSNYIVTTGDCVYTVSVTLGAIALRLRPLDQDGLGIIIELELNRVELDNVIVALADARSAAALWQRVRNGK